MITRETDYSMRLIIALADRQKKGIVSASSSEVAKEMDIPYRFLRKLVKRLVVGGLIESRRGKGGGVALAQEARSISLYDILTVTGPRGVELSLCSSDPKSCNRSALCTMQREFSSIQDEVDRRLKNIHISDLIQK
ncbi:MAG: Rrf2 family transcriptional regulator [bacterium]